MNQYLADFREKIENSFNELSNLSLEPTDSEKSSEKWSLKETLGHLIDSAFINYGRFLSALEKEDLVFDKYPRDEYVKIQNYNDRDWQDLLEIWKAINVHMIELAKRIPQSKLDKKTLAHNFDQICWRPVQENQKSNLNYLIKDYIDHHNHHLNKIIENRKR